MGEVEKPFICPEQNCDMRFTNEDHLQVHRRCHEIQLTINNGATLQPSSSLVKHSGFIIDQTPTPTRFLKHCEEVSLFQDINLNPFDLEFRKAAQNRSYRSQPSLVENQGVSGSLETPRILPPVDSDETISSTSRDDSHLSFQSSHLSPNHSSATTNTVIESPQLNIPSVNESEMQPEKREGRKRLTLNVSTSPEGGQSSNIISTPTPVITAGPSVSQSLGPTSCSTPTSLNNFNILTANIPHITLNGVGLGDLNTPGLSPALRLTASPSTSSAFSHHSGDQNSPSQLHSVEAKGKGSPLVSTPISVHVPTSLSGQSASSVPPSPSATVLQLLLRLPDGQAIPVEIPATPVVSSHSSSKSTTSVVTSIAPAYQTTAFTSVITNPTPSLAKMKLKQVLASSNTAARPGAIRHSRATTADRIAEMTRNRNLSGTSSNGGDAHEDSSSSCSSGASNGNPSKGLRRRRDSNPDENPDEKRQKFLERNRVAAVRCREKKKRLVESMAAKSDELGILNQRLQSEVASLRSEVASLKCLLLRHKTCPVTLAMQGEESFETKFHIEDAASSLGAKAPSRASGPQGPLAPSVHTQPVAFLPFFKTPSSQASPPNPPSGMQSPLSLPPASSEDSNSKLRKRSLSLSCIPPTSSPSQMPLASQSSERSVKPEPPLATSHPAPITSTYITSSPQISLHPYESPRCKPEHPLAMAHAPPNTPAHRLVPAVGKILVPSYAHCSTETPQFRGINISFPIETLGHQVQGSHLTFCPSVSSSDEIANQHAVRRNPRLVQKAPLILPKEMYSPSQRTFTSLSPQVVFDNGFAQSKIVINHQAPPGVSEHPQR